MREQSRRNAPCIFCGDRADSREHIFPAALGGRRVQKDILCKRCNGEFSREIDRALPRALGEIVRIIGIRPDHKDEPDRARGRDPRLRRDFLIGSGKLECRTREVRVHRRGRGALVTVSGEGSFQKEMEEFLRRWAEKDPGNIGTLALQDGLVVELRHKVRYGGRDFMRAIARIALNHLAAAYPDLARDNARASLRTYIATGQGDTNTFVWHDLDTVDRWYSPPGAPFVHRVTVTLRTDVARVQGRVVLFGGLPFGVDMGPFAGRQSDTVVFDIDPVAPKPHEWRRVFLRGVAAPIAPFRALSRFELARWMMLFFRRLDHWSWQRTGSELVSKINETRAAVPAANRAPVIASLLEQQRQRLLSLLHRTNKLIPDLLGWESDRSVDRARLGRVVAAQRGARFEIAPRTLRVLEEFRRALAAELSRQLVFRPLANAYVWQMLDGFLGAEVAMPLLLKAARLAPERLPAREIARRVAGAWDLPWA